MLNQRFDVKHIKDDFKLIGLPDTAVHAVAVKMNRLIVTYNAKDFRPLAQTRKETGVIGVSALMSYDHIDKKLATIQADPRFTNGDPQARIILYEQIGEGAIFRLNMDTK
jgi:tripartite-type tricarboxylate transporter receptor subunit TctC